MKKLFIILLTALFGQYLVTAQVKAESSPAAGGYRNILSFQAIVPVGIAQHTHIAGAGLSYSWIPAGIAKMDGTKFKLLLTGSVDHYLGKKMNIAGYSFRFRNYTDLLVQAGVHYEHSSQWSASAVAGPLVQLYEGTITAGAGLNLYANYFLQQRLAIGPGLLVRKQAETATLLAVAVRAFYLF